MSLILLAGLVYFFSPREPVTGSWVDRLFLAVTGPFQNGFEWIRGGVADTFSRYAELRRVEEENALLLNETRELRRELARLEEVRVENLRLRHLLDLHPPARHRALLAEVIGRDPTTWYNSITLDRGRSSGVRPDLPVVTAEGVVGQVVAVSGFYCRVRLATDPSSGVGVMDRDGRTPGVLSGRGTGDSLRLKYFDRNTEVQLGAVIVTSGLDGIFAKGIPVGYVSRIRRDAHQIFQDVLVRPYVSFGRLEEAQILLPVDDPGESSPPRSEPVDDEF